MLTYYKLAVSRRGKEQKITCIEFALPPSEAEFLFKAISTLRASERTQLYKISACQFVEVAYQSLPWIIKSNGKYYFGTDVD